MSESIPRLLRGRDVEEILGLAEGWAAKDRLTTAKIPFLRIGRTVRYREQDVLEYLNRCVRTSTSAMIPAMNSGTRIGATISGTTCRLLLRQSASPVVPARWRASSWAQPH